MLTSEAHANRRRMQQVLDLMALDIKQNLFLAALDTYYKRAGWHNAMFAGGRLDGKTRWVERLLKYVWASGDGSLADHRSHAGQERYMLAGGDADHVLYICTGDSSGFVPPPV